MNRMLNKQSFLRVLFDTIPLITLVLDSRLLVTAVNKAAAKLFDTEEGVITSVKGGEIMRCIHRFDDAEGCGHGPYCQECIVRNTAVQARQGNSIQRAKGRIEYEAGGEIKTMTVLVSTAPFVYEKENMVVIIIEDVSLVTELQGHIPICAECKKIRDDAGSWNRIENYLEKRSEAEFTHDLCPDCIQRLYPQQSRKLD